MAENPLSTSSVFELLATIRTRPAMYLGKPSIHHLDCFLGGWLHRDYDGIVDAALFGEFAAWVAKRYDVTSTQGWAKIIKFWSTDEVAALNNFYALSDEFQSLK